MKSTELKNGFLTFLGLGLYFLIMELLGLSNILFFRALNVFIIAYGMQRTIDANYKNGKMVFIENFASCMLTAIIASVLSMISLSIYIHYMGGEVYLQNLGKAALLTNTQYSINQYCIGLLFEGVASSIIVAYLSLFAWQIKHEKKHEYLS